MPQEPSKPYILSTDAAKRFKLTSDYIGVLCRRGKVRGMLVGRLWYVDQDSLAEYLEAAQAQKTERRAAQSKQWRRAWATSLLIFLSAVALPQTTYAAVGIEDFTSIPDRLAEIFNIPNISYSQRATAAPEAPDMWDAWTDWLSQYFVPGSAPRDEAAPAPAVLGAEVIRFAASDKLESALRGVAQMGAAFAAEVPAAPRVTLDASLTAAAAVPVRGGLWDAWTDWLAQFFVPETLAVEAAHAAARPVSISAPVQQNATVVITPTLALPEPAAQTVVYVPVPAPQTANVSFGVSMAELKHMAETLRAEIYHITDYASTRPVVFTAIAAADSLTLDDGDIPDDITASNYLPLGGGTLAGTLNSSSTATSTFDGGIQLTSGCFKLPSGDCAGTGGGGGGDVGSGTAGYVPFYASSGTSLTATSSIFINASSSVLVGNGNTATGTRAFVAGINNSATSYGFVGGGTGNIVYEVYGAIVGGVENIMRASYSFIGGGNANAVNNSYAGIVAGSSNTASASYTFIGSGYGNSISGSYSAAIGGYENTLTSGGQFSAALAGMQNTISGAYSYALGKSVTVSGSYSLGFGMDDSGYTVAQSGLAAFLGGSLAVGTTSSSGALHVATTTGKNIALTDTEAGSNLKHWLFGSRGGNLYVATSTDTYATSTIPAFMIRSNSYAGFGTTTPYAKVGVAGAVAATYYNADSAAATSTFAGGLNVGSGALTHDFSAGLTTIQNLAFGSLSFDTDAGIVSWFDMPVTSASSQGTVMSYSAGVAGTSTLTVYAEATGSGGATNFRVGIGTTSPSYVLDVASTTGAGAVARFTNTTGNCTINPTTTSLACSSDERLKKLITSLVPQAVLEEVQRLRPVTYNWNSESDIAPQHSGFIAQEVEPIFPDLVAKGDGGLLTLNYGGFVPYLVAAVQALYDTVAGYAEQFTTKKLCVEDVCVTREQFLRMVEAAGQQPLPPSAPPEPEPEAEVAGVEAEAEEAPAEPEPEYQEHPSEDPTRTVE